jgi:hypothetical protein
MTEGLLTPIEAINEFYRLKDKYESGYNDKYVKPILKSNKSKREKRVDFSKLPKHECINCKRNVGTIFSIIPNDKDLLRNFMAKCGDLSNPCPLDIQINYSSREPFDITISNGLNDIENIKMKIIKEKNNIIFFKSAANIVSVFERLTNDLKFNTEFTGAAIETDILRNDNPVKINLLNKTIDDFGKGFILPFKQMISDYIESNNELLLNQAIKFYIDEMLPKLKEIEQLRYEVNFVEYNENTGEYILIQRKNSLQDKEYCFESDDKVVKFVRGEMKTTKDKPVKTGLEELVIKTNNKLKKLDNKLELIEATEALQSLEERGEEGEEGEVAPMIPIKFQAEQFKETPIIEGNVITWENPKYNDAWKRFPQKLKDVLLSDHEWLEDFMNMCMNNKNNKKPCKLILPPNTVLPPTKNEDDGQYDFGSDIINRIFNRLSVSHKQTLLTLYSEKDGVKNYNMLRTTLEDLLEKEIGSNFNKGYI